MKLIFVFFCYRPVQVQNLAKVLEEDKPEVCDGNVVIVSYRNCPSFRIIWLIFNPFSFTEIGTEGNQSRALSSEIGTKYI